MTTEKDPILDSLAMAHLGSPKALLGKKGGQVLGEVCEFAMRGSMLDMAVGIIVGAAFGRVVSSFVSDVLMPPLGLLTAHNDFSNKFIDLSGQPMPPGESPKERRKSIRRSDKRLSILSLCRSDQSNPLSALHLCLNGGLSRVRNRVLPQSPKTDTQVPTGLSQHTDEVSLYATSPPGRSSLSLRYEMPLPVCEIELSGNQWPA